MVKVIMNGCNGHMGQVITGIIANDPEAEIVAGIDVHDEGKNSYPVFNSFEASTVEADVVIDFSSPKAFDAMMDYCVAKQVPVIVCTTGLAEEQIKRLEDDSKKVAVLRSANMSLGINLLLALADSINEALDQKYAYKYDRSQDYEPREKYEIGISAVRGGNIVGVHDVMFAGTDEVIEFTHTAYSKAVFGKGAVQAAKYLAGKPAGLYNMSDVIG